MTPSIRLGACAVCGEPFAQAAGASRRITCSGSCRNALMHARRDLPTWEARLARQRAAGFPDELLGFLIRNRNRCAGIVARAEKETP